VVTYTLGAWRFRPYLSKGKPSPVFGFLDYRFDMEDPRQVFLDIDPVANEAAVLAFRRRLEADRLIVDELRKAGADLSQPRDVRHYFYFPSARSAESAAEELSRDGFRVEPPLQTGASGESANPWKVLATTQSVVSVERVRWTSIFCRELAYRFGGEYDGWEAAAKP
jgi:hypothetical protein